MKDQRIANVQRKTKETDITMKLALDGTGSYQISTGIGFFDHMLEGFSKHGFFDLELNVSGDLQVDGHHTVEDVGIVLGQAFAKALTLNKPVVIDAFIDKDEKVYPMVAPGDSISKAFDESDQ